MKQKSPFDARSQPAERRNAVEYGAWRKTNAARKPTMRDGSERKSACATDLSNTEKNEEYEEGADARAKPEGTGKHIE